METSERLEIDGKQQETANGELPLHVGDPEAWLKELTTKHDYVCLVIFRGSWCPIDKYYLQKIGQLQKEKMKKAGVHLVAWTSEGHEGAKKADKEWGLTADFGFSEVLGDSTCALAKVLHEEKVLPNLETTSLEDVHLRKKHIITPGTYANGLVQPAVAFYAHHGFLMLHWEAEASPHFDDCGRPLPLDMWEQVQNRHKALARGRAVAPVRASRLRRDSNTTRGRPSFTKAFSQAMKPHSAVALGA